MNDACHEHNRSRPLPDGPKDWGVRLSLPENDPMQRILGDDWHEYHWFASEAAREDKIDQLSRQFTYYRKGDQPSFVIERVNRETAAIG